MGVSWPTIITITITIGGYLLSIILIPRILFQRRDASATLAWLVSIILMPYIGAFLYFILGRSRLRRRTRKMHRSRNAFEHKLEGLPHWDPACDWTVSHDEMPDLVKKISRVAYCVNQTQLLDGNHVDIYLDTDKAYDEMIAAIGQAKDHVHMMSYIFHNDQAGRRFMDALTAKAKENVEVRLLVDDFGSHDLNSGLTKPLIEAGGRFARFMPVMPFRPHWRPNFRNHRKILIVDGEVGFTGGLNIGDEYQGRKKKFAPWRDCHTCLKGPAVWRLQEAFAEDWFFTVDRDLSDGKYFPDMRPQGQNLVQVVNSGPDQDYETIHAVIFTAICEAQKRIYITTPYFVPDPAVLLALKSASWTGVDVRILVPGKTDHALIQAASRSYFRELLEAGVKIYEHQPGILHAKTMVVDGAWSTVGSANMDIRSFRLNFEINLLISGSNFGAQMESIFENDISQAKPLTLAALDDRSKYMQLKEAVGRMLSPVL
jgi:cardiolipin synthase